MAAELTWPSWFLVCLGGVACPELAGNGFCRDMSWQLPGLCLLCLKIPSAGKMDQMELELLEMP